jgi:putative tryptophan/tyrosine transport system substrate-binding protein
MQRRSFIRLLGAVLTSLPFAARAQKTPAVIAILGSGAAESASSRVQMSLLDAGMRDVGLAQGRDYVFDIRWAGSDASQFSALAAELLANNPRAVVVSTNLAALAVQKLSRTVPIVGTGLNAPVAAGLAASLAHPGGNITGVATMAEDMQAKLLEMLHETLPSVRRVMAIVNPTNPSHPSLMEGLTAHASRSGISIGSVNVAKPADLDAAFGELSRQPAGAIIVLTDNSLLGLSEPIVTRALAMRVPIVGNFSESFARAGAVFAYSRDAKEAFAGVARLLKKLLDGTAPGDIPFEQPTKFNLYVNLKSAKLLGVEIPPTLLAIADEVIE